jgi:glycosyltransferase involved in cell wall biosynthesis
LLAHCDYAAPLLQTSEISFPISTCRWGQTQYYSSNFASLKPPLDNPLCIVHTEASDGWGGQEIRILQEARWFRTHGHRIILAAAGDSQILKRFAAEDFQTQEIPFQRSSKISVVLQLAKLFKTLSPDVVATHSSLDSWSGLIAGRFARVPVALRYRHISAPVRSHFLNRLLYRRASDHVLTTAECIRSNLVRNLGLPGSKVTTVPTGIDPPAFITSRELARRELCLQLELPVDSRFLGCVAVLRSWKAQHILMASFDALAEEFPQHYLVLVGDGPGRTGLTEYRETLKFGQRILLTGHQNDPWPYFRAFDVAVLASYKDEGIPQSLLQAMFAECPVVGTDIGGIPEIVQHGETGLLATARSVSDLKERIATTLREPEAAKRRAQYALERVQQNHTLDRMGQRVLSIVYTVMKERKALEKTRA